MSIQCVTSHKNLTYFSIHVLFYSRRHGDDPRLRSVVAPTTQGTFQPEYSKLPRNEPPREEVSFERSGDTGHDIFNGVVLSCLKRDEIKSKRRERASFRRRTNARDRRCQVSDRTTLDFRTHKSAKAIQMTHSIYASLQKNGTFGEQKEGNVKMWARSRDISEHPVEHNNNNNNNNNNNKKNNNNTSTCTCI